MKYIHAGILSLSFFLMSFHAFAVSVYQCKDENGNLTFEKHCPPGTTQVDEKKLYTGKKEETTSSVDVSATLYSVPDCESCDEIRDFLKFRGISFTDKNVKDDIDLQNELKDVAGELKVPVLVIGEKVIKGYNRSEILAALKDAGYVEPEETPSNKENENTESSG